MKYICNLFGIVQSKCCYSSMRSQLKALESRILLSGPITVADYMNEVLTHPISGYYMNKDMFGEEGDFITSPEISQLFGEMLAVWTINEWQKVGSPIPFNLVELGPGRGTMLKDILRVFCKFNLGHHLQVHLVEVSNHLSKFQAEQLCNSWKDFSEKNYYRKGITANNLPIHWYKSVDNLPQGFSCFLAHEFFDALPIHKFQMTEKGWREILVDVDSSSENSLRYVIARNPTPASMIFARNENEKRQHIEVCPQAEVIMKELARRMEAFGGFSLVIDYGHEGEKTDTFRAFRSHNLHNPLVEPGSADLTADVDFSFLRKAVCDKLITFGPISQHDFLINMHIKDRLEVLLKTDINEKEKSSLISGYNLLVDNDKMGSKFKCMSFFPNVLKNILLMKPPAGFSSKNI